MESDPVKGSLFPWAHCTPPFRGRPSRWLSGEGTGPSEGGGRTSVRESGRRQPRSCREAGKADKVRGQVTSRGLHVPAPQSTPTPEGRPEMTERATSWVVYLMPVLKK